MSKAKTDKKHKKKQKQAQQVQTEQTCFDVIRLLKTQQLDTKPNMAKFLDQYVESIRGLVLNSKIAFYPAMRYTITKIFVKFLDGHELIYAENVLPGNPKCYMYDKLQEVELKEKDMAAVEAFFKFLLEFKFVAAEV